MVTLFGRAGEPSDLLRRVGDSRRIGGAPGPRERRVNGRLPMGAPAERKRNALEIPILSSAEEIQAVEVEIQSLQET